MVFHFYQKSGEKIMPRRKINNENDAASLLADACIKTVKGDMLPAELQAITNAVTAYGALKKQRRDAIREKKNQAVLDNLREEIDDVADGSLGLKLNCHKQLSSFKVK